MCRDAEPGRRFRERRWSWAPVCWPPSRSISRRHSRALALALYAPSHSMHVLATRSRGRARISTAPAQVRPRTVGRRLAARRDPRTCAARDLMSCTQLYTRSATRAAPTARGQRSGALSKNLRGTNSPSRARERLDEREARSSRITHYLSETNSDAAPRPRIQIPASTIHVLVDIT